MSNPNISPRLLDLEAWIEQVAADQVRRRQRQVTHILLHAVARTPVLREALYLKGGTLMSAAFKSLRQTGDVDFSAAVPPEPFATELRNLLDDAMKATAVELGYLDLAMRVQRFAKEPAGKFEDAQGPAVQMTIAIAERGGGAERRLKDGQAVEVLGIDISFKEPVLNIAVMGLDGAERTVLAYSVEEVIAEKLRALAQQQKRRRNRRQDIYDINWLIQNVTLDDEAKRKILAAFLEKSGARDVDAGLDAFDDPELKRRAGADWSTMELEIGELPDFDDAFDAVRKFYKLLPWD
jgi:predicted nucleotidyltransferase component of viral defense system